MPEFCTADREYLLDLATASVRHGLTHGRPAVVKDAPAHLCSRRRACFVTLKRSGQLRGCIGHIEPRTLLPDDVSRNAYAAAFEDPRFKPVTRATGLWVQISVLSEPELLEFTSRDTLIASLEPGTHGLIVEGAGRRATYLPSVWEQIASPQDFISQLLIKAGIPAQTADHALKAWRYTTESFATD